MNINPNILFETLLKKFGKPNWWPIDKTYHEKYKSDPRFEIIIGTILTQNTAWSNAEIAIDNLKLKNMLNIKKISNIDIDQLQHMVKPSGFFKQKAERLKNFAKYLHDNYRCNLNNFFNRDKYEIRKELLLINGIGPETADSILLYAGNKPIFVVDAYTKRICQRIPLKTNISYDEIQKFFQKKLSKKYDGDELLKSYTELHALIVLFAKNYCKKKPICINCPLKNYCNYKKKSKLINS